MPRDLGLGGRQVIVLLLRWSREVHNGYFLLGITRDLVNKNDELVAGMQAMQLIQLALLVAFFSGTVDAWCVVPVSCCHLTAWVQGVGIGRN